MMTAETFDHLRGLICHRHQALVRMKLHGHENVSHVVISDLCDCIETVMLEQGYTKYTDKECLLWANLNTADTPHSLDAWKK